MDPNSTIISAIIGLIGSIISSLAAILVTIIQGIREKKEKQELLLIIKKVLIYIAIIFLAVLIISITLYIIKQKPFSLINSIDSIKIGDIEWYKTTGCVTNKKGAIVLHDNKQKTEMWGEVTNNNLDCVFEAEFDHGKSNSSIGLEIWNPSEYSISFRGGIVKIVNAGQVMKMRIVKEYTGKRIKIHLKASDKLLYAEIDGLVIIDEPNKYWKGQKLKPRLNADVDYTVTLYSSFIQ